MPTTRQKRVAKLIIENEKRERPLTDIEILKSSNYSVSTSETKSTKIIKSEGVKKALTDYGFSEEGAKKVVQEIMYDERKDPNTRLKATDQVFKVHGSYAAEKSANVNVNVDASITPNDAEIVALREEYNAKLKKLLTRAP